MPFKWSVPYVLFFIAVTFLGFWQSYFSALARVPLAFHVHALTALVWLGLLLIQSWSIHQGRRGLHKIVGKASFVAFPLLILGLVMIMNRVAGFYLDDVNNAASVEPSVGAITVVAIAAYLVLYAMALRHRRNPKLHGGYMLATPLILFESPAGRATSQLFNWPQFADRTPIQEFGDFIAVLDAFAIALAIVLYFADRKHGAPWLIAAGFLIVQSLVAYYPDLIPGFRMFFAAYAQWPASATLTGALLAGVLAAGVGWIGGKPPKVADKTTQELSAH